MAPTKKSSSAKAPAKKPMVVKKSQYELERDARIKRNQDLDGFLPNSQFRIPDQTFPGRKNVRLQCH